MRKLDIIKEEARVNVVIIITVEELMWSVYLHSNLGHWDSLVMQDPKQKKTIWVDISFTIIYVAERVCELDMVLSAFSCII